MGEVQMYDFFFLSLCNPVIFFYNIRVWKRHRSDINCKQIAYIFLFMYSIQLVINDGFRTVRTSIF